MSQSEENNFLMWGITKEMRRVGIIFIFSLTVGYGVAVTMQYLALQKDYRRDLHDLNERYQIRLDQIRQQQIEDLNTALDRQNTIDDKIKKLKR